MTQHLDVDISGATVLWRYVNDGGDGNRADNAGIADARIECAA